MKRIRGFKLKHRVSTLFRFILRQNRSRFGFRRVTPSTCKTTSISNLISCLKTKAKSLCFSNPVRGYSRLGDNPVPKGQMAVYVGQKDGVFQRVLVPVIYFNHPLFGDLLREAEEEYGFAHPGGITIPCRISEFERVQTRIAAGNDSRRFLTWMKAS